MKTNTLITIAIIFLIASALIWKGFLMPKAYAPAPEKETRTTTSEKQVEEKPAVTIENAVISDRSVVATLSTGESKTIAKFVFIEDVEEFILVESYTRAIISPNGQFVALEGREQEKDFVLIYNLAADTLEKKVYGTSNGWSSEGLLSVTACNEAGAACKEYVSVSASTPWVVEVE